MRADNSDHIVRAARQRHDRTVQRARTALRRLDRAGEPISFRTVAGAASVSRSWLYRDQPLRGEIERLRAAQPPAVVTLPSAQRASLESLQRRLEAAHDEIRRLRRDNAVLRDQAARLFGQRRSDAITHESAPTTIEPIGARERHVHDAQTRTPPGFRASRSR